MDEKIFETSLQNITDKLGEEATAKIADDLGILKSAQKSALEEKNNQQAQIEQLNKDYSDMQKANARLLQQIPMTPNDDLNIGDTQKPEQKEAFDPRSCFVNGKLKI